VTDYTGLGFDPVPGDPRRVAALAESLTATARHATEAHDTVSGALDTSGQWHGSAADEFRRRTSELPARLAGHASNATAAARTLFDWSATLADQQRRAEELDRRARDVGTRLADAEQLADEWTTAVSVASTHSRPSAEAALAGHVRDRDALRAELASIRDAARALGTEHRAAEDRVIAELRALQAVPPTMSFGTLLSGLSTVTRMANAAAGLTRGPAGVPQGGAAVALAAPPATGRTWVFGAAVPVEQLATALPGDR
jgi:hypothetical protein